MHQPEIREVVRTSVVLGHHVVHVDLFTIVQSLVADRTEPMLPLGELPKRVNELDSADQIVAHCKSGARSAKAVEFLKQAGFKKVQNMKGGILAWSDKVDPSVPKY